MPEPLLSVRGLGKCYGPSGRWAVRDVSFELQQGRTLGLVGPSGCGKSTLAECVAGRLEPSAGEIRLGGRAGFPRHEIQLIPQQPAASLNPRFTAAGIVTEPLEVLGRGTAEWRRARALELMALAGLPGEIAGKRALECSGGERQRLAIARALAVEPKLLILDESLSGLDLSIQAQILELLKELQKRLGFAYILISHDPDLVAQAADEVIAMEDGAVAGSVPAPPAASENQRLAPRVRSPLRYIAHRAMHTLLLLLAVSVLSFLFADLAPGDFFTEMRMDPAVSSETLVQLRNTAGIGRPLPVRYARWLASIARGDFGYSLAYGSPVAPLLWPRMGATLLLTASATLLAWLAAAPLGIWSATRRGTWRDAASNLLLSAMLCVPDLLLAMVVLALAVRSGALPAGGMTSPDYSSMATTAARVRDVLLHLAAPAAVLALGMIPILARHARASMAEALDSPFAMAARAQGIPRRRLLFRHLLPVALNPLISLLGFSLGALLSASLLIEVVMGWPGLGPLFVDSVVARDFPVVLAVVMLSTVFLACGNLVADLLLYRADPRIRTERL